MALADAVEGARHVAQEITWKDEDGNVVDLDGSTISGVKKNLSDRSVSALDGTFTITDGPNGVFTWAYGAVDVGTAGTFEVQFTATYGAQDLDRTLHHRWEVHEAYSV